VYKLSNKRCEDRELWQNTLH